MFQPGTDNEALRELRDVLKDLNNATRRSNTVLVALTVLLAMVAFFQLVIAIFQFSYQAEPRPLAGILAIVLEIIISLSICVTFVVYMKKDKSRSDS